MPLAINSNMIGQFSDSSASSASQFRFFSLLPKPSFFPATVSEKRRSRTCSPLDCCEIWALRLQPNSEHSHRWEFWYHVWAERNTFHIVAFSFPVETQNGLSKIIIPISLTVGFSWNLDMLFDVQLYTLPPFGFAR